MCVVKKMLALDCGNSSYRLVLGRYKDDKLEMEVIGQEKNGMVRIKDLYYWDIMKMYDFLIKHLKELVKRGDQPDTIGICTWGVDFALFDQEGYQLGHALSYRNVLGEKILEEISPEKKVELFMKTGILSDRINSVYMLSALKDLMPSRISACRHVLMIPDIFNYLLTGVMINEPSELSTTQLFNSQTKEIDLWACDLFDIPSEWFSEIGEHGKIIGDLLPSVKEEIGIVGELPVICVPSHDTAAAVLAIPAEENEFLFISSGTWALIGAELDEPIINESVMEKGLTNEVGAYNKTTLLKNSTGMFILEKMKKEYEEELEKTVTWDDFLSISKNTVVDEWIDVNDSEFFNPVHMGKAIEKSLGYNKDILDWGHLVSIVQCSMAKNFADTILDIEDVTGKSFNNVYLVGGGSRNETINKLTAEYTGKTVITCGDESTCLGNLGAQLNYFEPKLKLQDIRHIINNSINMKRYTV